MYIHLYHQEIGDPIPLWIAILHKKASDFRRNRLLFAFLGLKILALIGVWIFVGSLVISVWTISRLWKKESRRICRLQNHREEVRSFAGASPPTAQKPGRQGAAPGFCTEEGEERGY